MTRCPGCGAEFADIDGPVHRYMESSPACWAAYGEVLAREYSDPARMAAHRLSVDAYAAQHPGQPSRPSIQSVGLHLVRLGLVLEHGVDDDFVTRRANEIMLAANARKQEMVWLTPPASLGEVTVKDVLATASAQAHVEMLWRWARSVWTAWAPHHATIAAWRPSRPDPAR